MTAPFTLHLGDCIEVMRGMADGSVDSIVCDPPYELSDDGKQSPGRVFVEFALPQNAKVESHLTGRDALPLFVSKILSLSTVGDIPRPSPAMPVVPMALDDKPTLRQQDIEHTSERSVCVSGGCAVGGVEPEGAKYLGSFALKLADPAKLLQVLQEIGTGFVSGGLGIGFATGAARYPSLFQGLRSVVVGDDDIRALDNALSDLIGALAGAARGPVFSLNLARGSLEQLTAHGALLLAAVLMASGAELIRAGAAARSLPSVLEARRIGVVGAEAHRAFSFDLIVHPQIVSSTGFMGHAWDGAKIAFSVEMWREALRVLKPGGHLLAFSGTRTQHRMVCAIEDAGFEVRDQIGWLYGSGFPKSQSVSKAIDKAAGAKREVIGTAADFALDGAARKTDGSHAVPHSEQGGHGFSDRWSAPVTAPASAPARQWEGWGTALKPAWEPVCVARKPLAKGCTVAANVMAFGTGAINIDGCRVDHVTVDGGSLATNPHLRAHINGGNGGHIIATETARRVVVPNVSGRWPANIIHDGSDEVMAAFPDAKGQQGRALDDGGVSGNAVYGALRNVTASPEPRIETETSAARFFYCAKASSADRHSGLEQPGPQFANGSTLRDAEKVGPDRKGNHHPTVKPTDLMAYLCRLVTPPGGVVLDPFMGSGSTGKAAMREGFRFVGIDMTAEYLPIAQARIERELARVAEATAVAAIPIPQLDLFQEAAC